MNMSNSPQCTKYMTLSATITMAAWLAYICFTWPCRKDGVSGNNPPPHPAPSPSHPNTNRPLHNLRNRPGNAAIYKTPCGSGVGVVASYQLIQGSGLGGGSAPPPPVSQKILRLRYTVGTSSYSWRNTTSAIVCQQTILMTTSSHS